MEVDRGRLQKVDQGRDGGGLDQDAGSEGGENWFDFG